MRIGIPNLSLTSLRGGGGNNFNDLSMDFSDGTNGLQDAANQASGGPAVTWNGGSQVDTTYSVSSDGKSASVNPSTGTDDYLSVDLEAFTGDFTLMAWVRSLNDFDEVAAYATIMGVFEAATNPGRWALFVRDYTSTNSIARRQLDFFVADPSDGTIEAARCVGDSRCEGDQWYHVAVCRSGSTISLFRDGVLEATDTYSGDVGKTATVHLGASVESPTDTVHRGNIDLVQIIDGMALLTANFEPPKTLISTSPSALQPVHFTFPGVAGSQSFADDNHSDVTYSVEGDIEVSDGPGGSLPSGYTGKAVNRPNTGGRISCDPQGHHFLAQHEFTIECEVYVEAGTTAQTICGRWSSGQESWLFGIDASERLFFYWNYSVTGTTYRFEDSGVAITTGSWIPVKVTRDATGDFRFYTNGVLNKTLTTRRTDVIRDSPASQFTIGATDNFGDTQGAPLNDGTYVADLKITLGAVA